jgi:hypothetical protein
VKVVASTGPGAEKVFYGVWGAAPESIVVIHVTVATASGLGLREVKGR